MVAVAMMAVVLVGTAYIFKTCIDMQRTATATAEIMRNLRGITDQLDSDLRGIRKDMPIAVFFSVKNNLRADRMRFFANGDFQSVRQYSYNASTNYKTAAGNVACIGYGQSWKADPFFGDSKKKILTRKQTILASDPCLPPDPCTVPTQEYQQISPAVWLQTWVKPTVDSWTWPPTIDPNNVQAADVPLFMAKGVDNFTIQVSTGADPNGSGSLVWWPTNQQVIANVTPPDYYYPRGVKFTFTLYDSKGIIKGGRIFTHIVYLNK